MRPIVGGPLGVLMLSITGILWVHGSTEVLAQVKFTLVTSEQFRDPEFRRTGVWFDLDGDHFLDIIGKDKTGIRLYKNQGGQFTEVPTAIVVTLESPTFSWGDYDRDNDFDLLIWDRGSSVSPVAILYRNDALRFTKIDTHFLSPDILGVNPVIAWGDYDNDRDLDVLFNTNQGAQVFRNDGADDKGGWVFALFQKMDRANQGMGWINYDNTDAGLEIWVKTDTNFKIYDLFHNLKPPRYDSNWLLFEIQHGFLSSFGDFNKDGKLDFLAYSTDLQAWTTNRVKLFSLAVQETILPPREPWHCMATAVWGDFDNDNNVDILCSTNIFRNLGVAGPVPDFFPITLPEFNGGSDPTKRHYIDYDNDGDLDVWDRTDGLYRNDTKKMLPPTISAFSPSSVDSQELTEGKTELTIQGANFTPSAIAWLHQDVSPSDVKTVSNATMTVLVPAGIKSGPITVETEWGRTKSSANLIVDPLALKSFTPTSGAATIQTTVTISGTGFTSPASVTFGNSLAITPNSVSPTAIRVSVPPSATTGPISVKTPEGVVKSTDNFTVTALTISSFTPKTLSEGDSVVITGNLFTNGTKVAFNGKSAAIVDVVSLTQITTQAPAGLTPGRITVTSSDGKTVTSAEDFAVFPLSLNAISPSPDAKSLEFDGHPNHFFRVAKKSGSDDGLRPRQLTVEAWVKIESFGPYRGIVGNGLNRTAGYQLMTAGDGSPRVVFTVNGVDCASDTLQTNTWYHIAGIYNGTDSILYVDGRPARACNGPSGGVTYTNVGDLHIGAYKLNNQFSSFKGRIGEVRVWNSALAEAAIADWYYRAFTDQHPNRANLAGHWGFTNENPVCVADSTGQRKATWNHPDIFVEPTTCQFWTQKYSEYPEDLKQTLRYPTEKEWETVLGPNTYSNTPAEWTEFNSVSTVKIERWTPTTQLFFNIRDHLDLCPENSVGRCEYVIGPYPNIRKQEYDHIWVEQRAVNMKEGAKDTKAGSRFLRKVTAPFPSDSYLQDMAPEARKAYQYYVQGGGFSPSNIFVTKEKKIVFSAGSMSTSRPPTESYKINTATIVEHNVCKKISSNRTLFVPTKTVEEWASFFLNPPAGVRVEDCAP